MSELFPDFNPKIKTRPEKCKTCKHIQRWKYTHVTIYYCGIRHSNRTYNKLLKIKANNEACKLYEELEK